jgi:NDP-mannose synthase
MRAVILAGGKGARLAPYTTVLPKPLMPIDEKPILEIVIRQLARHGFQDITLAVGYLAELIMAVCGEGQKYGVHLTYSHEETPLGTAGPLALVPDLKETFLFMNGDLLCNLDFSAMLTYHRERAAVATLAAFQREVQIDLGVVEADRDGWLTKYIEKPRYHYSVSTGIYIFEPTVLEFVPHGEKLDLPDLILKLTGSGHKVNVYPFEGYWLDIGRPDDYEKAIEEFRVNRAHFLTDE